MLRDLPCERPYGNVLKNTIFINVSRLEVCLLNMLTRNHFAFGTPAFEESFLISGLFSTVILLLLLIFLV